MVFCTRTVTTSKRVPSPSGGEYITSCPKSSFASHPTTKLNTTQLSHPEMEHRTPPLGSMQKTKVGHSKILYATTNRLWPPCPAGPKCLSALHPRGTHPKTAHFQMLQNQTTTSKLGFRVSKTVCTGQGDPCGFSAMGKSNPPQSPCAKPSMSMNDVSTWPIQKGHWDHPHPLVTSCVTCMFQCQGFWPPFCTLGHFC